jgi:hypothetical protein
VLYSNFLVECQWQNPQTKAWIPAYGSHTTYGPPSLLQILLRPHPAFATNLIKALNFPLSERQIELSSNTKNQAAATQAQNLALSLLKKWDGCPLLPKSPEAFLRTLELLTALASPTKISPAKITYLAQWAQKHPVVTFDTTSPAFPRKEKITAVKAILAGKPEGSILKKHTSLAKIPKEKTRVKASLLATKILLKCQPQLEIPNIRNRVLAASDFSKKTRDAHPLYLLFESFLQRRKRNKNPQGQIEATLALIQNKTQTPEACQNYRHLFLFTGTHTDLFGYNLNRLSTPGLFEWVLDQIQTSTFTHLPTATQIHILDYLTTTYPNGVPKGKRVKEEDLRKWDQNVRENTLKHLLSNHSNLEARIRHNEEIPTEGEFFHESWKIQFSILHTLRDYLEEGHNQNHCVGSYFSWHQKSTRGERVYRLICSHPTEDTTQLTLERDNYGLRQLQGYQNVIHPLSTNPDFLEKLIKETGPTQEEDPSHPSRSVEHALNRLNPYHEEIEINGPTQVHNPKMDTARRPTNPKQKRNSYKNVEVESLPLTTTKNCIRAIIGSRQKWAQTPDGQKFSFRKPPRLSPQEKQELQPAMVRAQAHAKAKNFDYIDLYIKLDIERANRLLAHCSKLIEDKTSAGTYLDYKESSAPTAILRLKTLLTAAAAPKRIPLLKCKDSTGKIHRIGWIGHPIPLNDHN